MNTLQIEGAGAYDGTYEFEDFENFTNGELHRIKKLTGLRVGEFQEAFEVGDNDLMVALAVIVLERNGRKVIDTALWNAPAGAFTFDFTGAEEEADPTKDGAPPAQSDSDRKTGDSPSSSGPSSTEPSGLLENGQSRIGVPV